MEHGRESALTEKRICAACLEEVDRATYDQHMQAHGYTTLYAFTAVECQSEKDRADLAQAKELLRGIVQRALPDVFTFKNDPITEIKVNGLAILE